MTARRAAAIRWASLALIGFGVLLVMRAAPTERILDVAQTWILADQSVGWWLEPVPFFDVQRERIWVFWRRVLHTAHHRTQLTVYLRLLGRPVPAVYGPTADVTWRGADPTTTIDAAGR